MTATTITAPLYETADVARQFGVTGESVRKWVRAGIVSPARTVGGSRIFTQADLEVIRQARADHAATRAARRDPCAAA